MDAKILGLCATAIIIAAAGAIPSSAVAARRGARKEFTRAINAIQRRPRTISGTIIPAGHSTLTPLGITLSGEARPPSRRLAWPRRRQWLARTLRLGLAAHGGYGRWGGPRSTEGVGRASPPSGDGGKFGCADLTACRRDTVVVARRSEIGAREALTVVFWREFRWASGAAQASALSRAEDHRRSDACHLDHAPIDRMDFPPRHRDARVDLAAIDFLILRRDLAIERDEPSRIFGLCRGDIENRLLGPASVEKAIYRHRDFPQSTRSRREGASRLGRP